jgi:DNA (cytosine-5)-methyltransferase 1
VPQNRERVFIVGIRDDEDNYFRFPKEEPLKLKLKDVLEDEVDNKYYLSESAINSIINNKDNIQKSKINPSIANALQSPGNACGVYKGANYIKTHSLYPRSSKTGKGGTGHLSKEDGTSYCVDTGNSQAIEVHGAITGAIGKAGSSMEYLKSCKAVISNTNKIRRLTPRECFRLQDFPETFNWPCSDSQAYKQAGNSITVGVLAKIIEKLNL